jgi:polyhydroxyalkanoate synthesis regulator phasin
LIGLMNAEMRVAPGQEIGQRAKTRGTDINKSEGTSMRVSTAGFVGGLLLGAAASAGAGSVDAKLLDMLLKNGSITAEQHAELSADLKRETRKEEREAKQYVKEKDFTAFNQLAGWATKTKLTGDMRVRHEATAIEGEPNGGTFAAATSATTRSSRDRSRQRIRARVGATTLVNNQVEMGIQIATGNSADRRSTNQDMDGMFDKKSVWLDLGYINYKPTPVPGLQLIAGKMKQPWMSVADMMWDGDINPEGFAAAYQKKNGTTTLFGSAGYYVMKDNVDGDGVKFNNDLALYQAQIGAAFDMGSSTRLTLGAGINDFNNERQGRTPDLTVPFRDAAFTNGNTTDAFRLYELLGQMDVIGLPLPLSVYAHYVKNDEAADLINPNTRAVLFRDGNEDTAWLLGLRSNVAGVAIDYNYRDVQRNAVVGAFTDSDFGAGFTTGKGHKLKLQYDFLTNFYVAMTYFKTESDVASRFDNDGAGADTFFIDLNAKF